MSKNPRNVDGDGLQSQRSGVGTHATHRNEAATTARPAGRKPSWVEPSARHSLIGRVHSAAVKPAAGQCRFRMTTATPGTA